jgi:peroxin-3
LISTISFTFYALLPTLYPQLSDEYPVENTSQALQNFSAATSTADPTPDHSMVLPHPAGDSQSSDGGTDHEHQQQERGDSAKSHEHGNVTESWTSEFQTESVAESEVPSIIDAIMAQGHEDDTVRRLLWLSNIANG